MKKLLKTQRSDTSHWVGDGFPVRTIFGYNDLAKDISPFLMLDYGGPTIFTPSNKIRGVGEHPHRGFETVTIVYAGEVDHRDSSGGGGSISPGDVQWMTAASGLVHEEMHSKKFSQEGGAFEMIQLWVNLPRKYKTAPPKYQAIKNNAIPVVPLPDQGGIVRVIAGEYLGLKGPTQTFTPINLWDIRLSSNRKASFTVPTSQTAAIFVLSGSIILNDGEHISEAEIAVLDTVGEEFTLQASVDSKLLFLGGAPLNEPIVGYGPFVMNTLEEIQQAFMDYKNGKMGNI